MNADGFNRLHNLRMQNDAVKFEMDEQRPRFDRLADRHENGAQPRGIAVHQLFQTPPELADRLVALLDLQPGARVLEPSAGLGRLLDALILVAPREVVAVDIEPKCTAELYRQERPGVIIKQRDFLTVQPEELGEFDAVVMNPPFTMRSDIKHIRHALNFLRHGGTLAAICLDAPNRREALGPLVERWIEIEAGAFKCTGTRVDTAMLVIRK